MRVTLELVEVVDAIDMARRDSTPLVTLDAALFGLLGSTVNRREMSRHIVGDMADRLRPKRLTPLRPGMGGKGTMVARLPMLEVVLTEGNNLNIECE